MYRLRDGAAVLAGLYRERADALFAGYVLRDPVARLRLRPGREDPYAIYDGLRERGPLVRTRRGRWITTSHRLGSAVLRDRRFGVVSSENRHRRIAFDASFLTRNPPDHTRLRRLVQPDFNPRAVAAYRDRIERTVGGLLDRAAATGTFDLVSEIAVPLPIAVITDLLGVPDADAKAFARYGRSIASALDGVTSLPHAARLAASGYHLMRLFDELFELRRREPADDIVSRVVAAEGDSVAPEEMLSLCLLLLVAGFETTVNLIGNAVVALLRHPEQWKALCADPEALAPGAVAETLRFDPPVQQASRVALEPVEIEGRVVERDEWIITLIGAANRDPEVYERPDTFDLSRTGGPDHLAFGGGIHYCVGAPLAVLEATVALRMLAQRFPGLSLAGPVRRRNATVIRGPIHAPLRTV